MLYRDLVQFPHKDIDRVDSIKSNIYQMINVFSSYKFHKNKVG